MCSLRCPSELETQLSLDLSDFEELLCLECMIQSQNTNVVHFGGATNDPGSWHFSPRFQEQTLT